MPKWITKPEPVDFSGNCPCCGQQRVLNRPVTLDEILGILTEDGGQFGAGMKAVRAATGIMKASEKAGIGEAFVLNDEWHASLIAALERPQGRVFVPSFMRQMEPLVVAIEEATNDKPAESR